MGNANIPKEGPQFSTRAESNMYRSWGGTVINMSTLPEAKLAAEAEIAYQVILMSTDYDVSVPDSLCEVVTASGDQSRLLDTSLTSFTYSAGTTPATSRSKWSWVICVPTP